MTIRDGKKRIRRFWGGYSPKIHDGLFLELQRSEFERDFKVSLHEIEFVFGGNSKQGAGILGDEHFAKGHKLFDDPVFYTPYKKPANGVLTSSKARWNRDVRVLRARVEWPYGWLKRTFECFQQPWMEPLNQMDHVFAYACAVHNLKVAS